MALLEVKNLKKVYTTRFGTNQVKALSDVNFSVEKGEYVAIMGESGSGKTTLLNILASLDKPTNGEILLNGKNTVQIKDKELSAFRRDNLGFVFQDFNLLDTFTIRDNIFLPLVLSGKKYNEMEERVKPLSKRLGIEQLLTLFNEINCDGQTILMVTHSTKAASRANRVLFIKDGVVFHQIYKGSMTDDSMYTKISDTLTALATGGDNIE